MKKRILALAIDDDPGILVMLQRRLPSEGIDVVPADALADGMREIAQNDFDCILLDLNLSDSLGMLTFWKLKASIRKPTPIIVVSGAVTPPMELELAHNDVRVLTKPLLTEDIVDTIRLVVSEAEQARSQSSSGTMIPSWVTQLRDEMKDIVKPMQHDLGRVVAWMEVSLAAQTTTVQTSLKRTPKPKRSMVERFEEADWAKLGVAFVKFVGVVTVASAAATACVRVVVVDALKPIQQSAQQNQTVQSNWRIRDRVEDHKPAEQQPTSGAAGAP